MTNASTRQTGPSAAPRGKVPEGRRRRPVPPRPGPRRRTDLAIVHGAVALGDTPQAPETPGLPDLRPLRVTDVDDRDLPLLADRSSTARGGREGILPVHVVGDDVGVPDLRSGSPIPRWMTSPGDREIGRPRWNWRPPRCPPGDPPVVDVVLHRDVALDPVPADGSGPEVVDDRLLDPHRGVLPENQFDRVRADPFPVAGGRFGGGRRPGRRDGTEQQPREHHRPQSPAAWPTGASRGVARGADPGHRWARSDIARSASRRS